MTFKISINGKPFERWKSARITRSIDSNCGVFGFTNSTSATLADYPVREGDFVKILIKGIPKITGYIDNVSGSHSVSEHSVNVSGRDNVQDLIDSSVPDAAKVTAGPVSLLAMCEKLIGSLGAVIPVITNVDIDDFTSEDLQAAGAGETGMSYLVSFARKKQVYLVTDGAGNMLVYRPDRSNYAKTTLVHTADPSENNILSSSFSRAMENRFNSYLCRSQDNFGFDPFADYSTGGGCNRNGTAIDDQIRSSRYLEIQSEQSMSDRQCKDRAAEESNIRRTSALHYTCTVPGVTQDDGTLWDFGQIVKLKDDYASISGEFLIKSVEYTVDITSGALTRLTLVPPDAYQVTAVQSDTDKRKAMIS